MTLGNLNIKVSQEMRGLRSINMATTILGGGFLNIEDCRKGYAKRMVLVNGAGAGFQADSMPMNQIHTIYLYAILRTQKTIVGTTGVFWEELDRL